MKKANITIALCPMWMSMAGIRSATVSEELWKSVWSNTYDRVVNSMDLRRRAVRDAAARRLNQQVLFQEPLDGR